MTMSDVPDKNAFTPEVLTPFDVRHKPMPAPAVGVFDTPLVKVCINSEWASHLDGLLDRLLYRDAWTGTDAEIDDAIDQVRAFVGTLGQPTVDVCEEPQLQVRQNPALPCKLEYSADAGVTWIEFADLQLCPPLIRKTAQGQIEIFYDNGTGFGWYEVDDGPTPTTPFDGYHPTKPMLVQTNDECTAAANAAYVIRKTYESASQVLAGTILEQIAAKIIEIGGVLLTLTGATIGPDLLATVAGTAYVAQSAFGIVAFDDGTFHELVCIFDDNISGSVGNWTFNGAGITSALNAKIAANPAVWTLIKILCDFVGVPGLEIASKTTFYASYNCAAGLSVEKMGIFTDWTPRNNNGTWQIFAGTPTPASIGLMKATLIDPLSVAGAAVNPTNTAVAAGYMAVVYPAGNLDNATRNWWLYNPFFYNATTALAAIRAIVGDPTYTPARLGGIGNPVADAFPPGIFIQTNWQTHTSATVRVHMTQEYWGVRSFPAC